MNKMLSTTELEALSVPAILPMMRREKLLRFAAIVRGVKQRFIIPNRLHIFHALEYMSDEKLDGMSHSQSAFALAAQDPALVNAGLKSDFVGEAKRFFELSNEDLHAFSCDCGGEITPTNMADRIEAIANR